MPHRARFVVLAVLAQALLLAASRSGLAEDGAASLRKQGTATQLIVGGKPWIMLGGELHNSSSSNLEYMKTVWPKLRALGLNTALAAVSWEIVEPREGEFDFAVVDGLIEQARQNEMKLVLLWFGSWKNGVSSYAPGWVKRDTARFPRCKGSSNQNTKDVLSPLSEANQKADARAFAALMRRLKQIDGREQTVVMVQVQNEVGIKPEPRDLSPAGDAAFNSPVPAALIEHFVKHKAQLHPELKAHWEKAGSRTAGTWPEVFGDGPQAAEIFSAWHYARYIDEVAKAGKAEYPLPMFVNAWLRGPNAPVGSYPTGGPVSHVLDIWRAAAPHLDFYAPDIYLPDFKAVCAEYTRSGNPLMIPEASRDENAAGRAFWAIAEHDAICFAPFGIESIDANHPLADAYAILRQLLSFVGQYQGTNRLVGIYQEDGGKELDERLTVGQWTANVRGMKRGLSGNVRPYGLILQTGDEEFLVAGYGFQVNFGARTAGPRSTGILSVEMGHIEGETFVSDLRLNGDETGANHVAQIPPNTSNLHLDPSKPRLLRVRVYRYD